MTRGGHWRFPPAFVLSRFHAIITRVDKIEAQKHKALENSEIMNIAREN